MRVVGNDCSHSPGLSDDQIQDLCVSIRAMTKAFRYFARLRDEEKCLIPEDAAPISVDTPSLPKEKIPSPPTSPPTPTTSSKALLDTLGDNGVKTDMATPAASSPSLTGYVAALARPPAPTPTRGTSFKYFETIPTLVGKDVFIVERLERHYAFQPKARFCLEPSTTEHDRRKCELSHTLKEVLSYNPLYKLFPCPNDSHYPPSGDVVEIASCPFLHVDVGFPTQWISLKTNGKQAYCPNKASCRRSCLRSHSLQELCFYNPWFKIQPCDKTRCRAISSGDSLVCNRYHTGLGDKREQTQESDYVGQRTEILHIDRTHRALIRKLKGVPFTKEAGASGAKFYLKE